VGAMSRAHAPGRYLIARCMLIAVGMLLACCPCAFALDPSLDISQYAHTAWKIREGFTKGTITTIAQTPDGYLWLGTEFGLLRFDGVRTVPWQPPPDQHIPSSTILRLLVARDGALWIGTSNGLASWKGGKLTQYAELAGQYVFTLLEDREGSVWAGGYGIPSGRLCAIQNGSVQCHGEDGALGHGVFKLYEDSKGKLWVGVLTGVWRWKPGPPKFYALPGQPDGIQGLAEDDDSKLLIGTINGIRRIVDGNAETYPLPGRLRGFQAHRLLRDRDGGLWIGTTSRGLVHVHQGRADVFGPADGLSGEDVSSFFEDREGDIWVATINGLDRFRDFAVATFSVNQGLSDANVGSVLAARDGSVWLSTRGGLDQWNDGKIITYDKRLGKLNGLAPNSLFQDARGRVWVSTLREFGYLENDRFVSVSGVPGGAVHGIAEDTASNLWIANQNHGLIQLFRGSVVQQIPWATLGHKDIATALAADPLQTGLWLGFYSGGVEYFSGGQVRASYSAADGLGEGRVNDLRLDPEGTLWAATEGGLSRLKNGRVATLSSKNGLPCDDVHWVMEDDAHSLWLYMPCGLVRVARPELDSWVTAVDKDNDSKRRIQATAFDSSDGVRSHSGAGGFTPRIAKTSDGKLWFLPWDGVSVVDPRHLPYNKLPPPVHVEQITADRKTYDAPSQTRLPPLVRDLEVDYTALSFVAPEKVLFRYKLEGWDRDWQDVGNRRQAFYSNLSPGNYRFRVIACNNSGVWNEAGTFLDFSIAPAYYQSNWFRVTCVAAFMLLLWALYQLRLRQIARQFQVRLEERIGERTRIARELHDTLLQGFQGLMFRLQAVRYLLPERPAEAGQALDTALDRGGQVIAEGRDAVQNLRSSTVVGNDLVHGLTILAEELAAPKGNAASPTFRILLEGPPRDFDLICRDDIYRIAREALVNAFHHACAQKIEAEITYGYPQFRLRIRDDGTGIDSSVRDHGKRSGHWGLTGMRERAKTIGGRLEVWSEEGAGTEVDLTIPSSIAYSARLYSAHTKFGFFRRKSETREQRS
jgi:signal transduction histidine kinase/ligand-binding sensor domain-containing protein